jgi:pseudaminic acid biosynthesis-associated methylase
MTKSYRTEQEAFWAGEFGVGYIDRNADARLLASNLRLFAGVLQRTGPIASCIEFGANIGMNLRAIKLLQPQAQLRAVEINPEAAKQLSDLIGKDNTTVGSMFDHQTASTVDLSFSKGVLIHVQPEMLPTAYQKLFDASHRYVLLCEYYNPTPVSIPYRGHSDRLFKRDFAGEMLDRFPQLSLIDYGFVYRRDPAFPQDDVSWFLMKRTD